MKTLLRHLCALVLTFSLLSFTSVHAQNIGSLPGKAKTAGAGLVVTFDGGKSTVMYQGKKVFEGATKQKAVGVVKNVNGVQYAAAFDGSRPIWENVKGASAKVR